MRERKSRLAVDRQAGRGGGGRGEERREDDTSSDRGLEEGRDTGKYWRVHLVQLVQPFGLCAGLDWVVGWVGLGWVNPKMTSGLRIGQGQTPPYHPPRTVDMQAVMYRDFFERCLRSTPLYVFPTYIVHNPLVACLFSCGERSAGIS